MQVLAYVMSYILEEMLGLSSNRLSIFVIVVLVTKCTGLGIADIDEDHLAMYPYCGSMHQGITQTESRAINSEGSKEDYRWTALLVRENTEPKSNKVDILRCSGSIITDR